MAFFSKLGFINAPYRCSDVAWRTFLAGKHARVTSCGFSVERVEIRAQVERGTASAGSADAGDVSS
jgi:hypothetical protein